MQERKFIPVTEWNRFHIWPTVAALRFYIFNAEFDGFNKVVKKVGRRCLIDEMAFFQWIEERDQATRRGI